ncbi:MAG: aldehyde dehydrogenase family protein [Candidatus Cloacimonadota bacterium]|nr:MAG: aldehyde dehydrogenase family protein [Candidatus Cloacimonadota bacterium]
MTEVYKNFIGGKWVESESKRTFENRNPANWDEIVGIFPKSTAKDVENAVDIAKKAFESWKRVPVPKRGEILGRCGDIMVERKEELAKLETREMGKVIKETRGDVQEGIDTAYYAFGEGRRLFGITTPSELPDKICYTVRKPIGVAGLITPWNFPMAIPCWKVIPALLSGNSVVIKPASATPATATKLVEILNEAGIPEGVVNIVHGTGREVGEALLAHPDIGVISFTGSSEVGSRIAEVSGKMLKRVSLELGGKNAQIVMQDADLDLALEGVLWGAFGTTGQRCTATSRLILNEKIYDKFIEMIKERAKKIKIGNGLEETVEMGPVINSGQRDVIHNYVKIGKEERAKLVLGGNFYEEGECAKGWFYEPTIFIDVKSGMRIEQEEIFGPVLSVIKFSEFDDAIKIMNDTNYGLSSSIYTRDVNLALKAAEEIEAGITYINGPTIGAECHLPFGGVKNTGNGHREGGLAVYEIFTEIKTIYFDYSGKLQKAQIDTSVEK